MKKTPGVLSLRRRRTLLSGGNPAGNPQPQPTVATKAPPQCHPAQAGLTKTGAAMLFTRYFHLLFPIVRSFPLYIYSYFQSPGCRHGHARCPHPRGKVIRPYLSPSAPRCAPCLRRAGAGAPSCKRHLWFSPRRAPSPAQTPRPEAAARGTPHAYTRSWS